MRAAISARTAMVPSTIPAMGPPPIPPFFGAGVGVDVGVADIVENIVVKDVADEDEEGLDDESVRWPPSLVDSANETDTVYPVASRQPYPTDPPG